MSILISQVARKFLRYFRDNPGWGCFHCILDDGNFDSVPGIADWLRDEKASGATVFLAEALEKMEPWQKRRIAEVIPEMAKGRKFTDYELDEEPKCEWCGGEVDDDGECLIDYCKGNSNFSS